jgi:hypothetical protein
MNESKAMIELRKIRDENSLRHLKMTSDELNKEFDESVKWFIQRLGKDVKIVSKATS